MTTEQFRKQVFRSIYNPTQPQGERKAFLQRCFFHHGQFDDADSIAALMRLMEEAGQESEHKGWCDTELSTNEQTRKEKTAAVETLHAEIDELKASIAKLTQEITDAEAAVDALYGR